MVRENLIKFFPNILSYYSDGISYKDKIKKEEKYMPWEIIKKRSSPYYEIPNKNNKD